LSNFIDQPNPEGTIGNDYHYPLLMPTKLALLQRQSQASSVRAASGGSLPLVWKAYAQLPVTHVAMSQMRHGAW